MLRASGRRANVCESLYASGEASPLAAPTCPRWRAIAPIDGHTVIAQVLVLPMFLCYTFFIILFPLRKADDSSISPLNPLRNLH
jgi:hypothetical protein